MLMNECVEDGRGEKEEKEGQNESRTSRARKITWRAQEIVKLYTGR